MEDFRRSLELLLEDLRDSIVAQHEQEMEALRKEAKKMRQQLDHHAGGRHSNVEGLNSEQSMVVHPESSTALSRLVLSHSPSLPVTDIVEDPSPDTEVVVACTSGVSRHRNRAERFVVNGRWRDKYDLLKGSVVVTHETTLIESTRPEMSRVLSPSLTSRLLGSDGQGHYRFILDPDSYFSTLRGWISLALLMYDLIYIPVDLAFDAPESTWREWAAWVAMVFWTVDILLSCVTGVYVSGQKEMRFKKIVCRYSMTWLPLDMTIVFADWIVYIIYQGHAKRAISLLRSFSFVRIVGLLRLGRLRRTLSLIGDTLCAEIHDHTPGISDTITTLLHLVVLVHLLSCMWYGLGRSANASWVTASPATDATFYNYFSSVLWTLTLLQAPSEIQVQSAAERGLACATAFTALFLCAYIFGRTTWVVFSAKSSGARNLVAISWRFAKARRISHSLAKRVHHYLRAQKDEGIDKQLANEHKLVASLPVGLQVDIHAEIRKPSLISVQFFCDLHTYHQRALHMICHVAMTEVLTLGQNVAFAAGDACFQMIFATGGSFTYMPGRRKQFDLQCNGFLLSAFSTGDVHDMEHPTTLVEKGAHLCEPTLWTTWEHKGDLIATQDSLSLALSADKFELTIRQIPTVCVHALKYARQFVWHLNHGTQPIESDIIDICIPMDRLEDDFFSGNEVQHFIFISHYKQESGTEATLMAADMQRMVRHDPNNAASELKYPIFLDSENLRDLSALESHVKQSRYMLLLLTPGVLSRPWCLLEIVHAVRHGVEVIPIEMNRPGPGFEFPTEKFYSRILAGEVLTQAAVDLLRDEGIALAELVRCIRTAFRSIALTFSPHRSAGMRQTELAHILKSCKPIPWTELHMNN